VTLETLSLALEVEAPTAAEEVLITAAEARIRRFGRRHPEVTTLLNSDPRAFCRGLHALRQQGRLAGNRFCDWGSGIGLLCALAALDGFDAYGIETEPGFVAEAAALCRDFSLAVRFACGSFVPPASGFRVVGTYGATDWRAEAGRDLYAELGRRCQEMDLIYAYPWPRELPLYQELFDSTARAGAVLWLYRHGEAPELSLKTG